MNNELWLIVEIGSSIAIPIYVYLLYVSYKLEKEIKNSKERKK